MRQDTQCGMQLSKYRCQVPSEMHCEAHVGLVDLTGDAQPSGLAQEWEPAPN